MIAVAGTIVVDVPAHPVAGMPERGGLEAVERIDLYVGGVAANTGITLSRLGVPVGVIGCVGKDPLGRIVMDELSGWAEGPGSTRTTPVRRPPPWCWFTPTGSAPLS